MSDYIIKQLNYYRSAVHPAAKTDALWRIASNQDLFTPAQLNAGLSEEQLTAVRNWLRQNGYNL